MDYFAVHSDQDKDRMYRIYLEVFQLPISLQKKYSIVSTMICAQGVSWPVVGITESALNILEENNYKYKTGTICRAHIVDRHRTADAIFNRKQPVSKLDLFRIIWENDKTVIALKKENGRQFVLPPYLPIDPNLRLFPSGAVVGFRHSKPERVFLQELHALYKDGSIKLVTPNFEICGLEPIT